MTLAIVESADGWRCAVDFRVKRGCGMDRFGTIVWRIGAQQRQCLARRGVHSTGAANREEYVNRGRRLEHFTIGYNSLEGVTSMGAGLIAGPVSPVRFGRDCLIEVTSGATLLWRLQHNLDFSRREQVERIAFANVACFVALALYRLYESSAMLIRHVPPGRSIAGIVIAAISVIVMPPLARAKRRVASQLGSEAMHADSKQAAFCSYLSAILLGGLLLNALVGWS